MTKDLCLNTVYVGTMQDVKVLLVMQTRMPFKVQVDRYTGFVNPVTVNLL